MDDCESNTATLTLQPNPANLPPFGEIVCMAFCITSKGAHFHFGVSDDDPGWQACADLTPEQEEKFRGFFEEAHASVVRI